jgi:recombinational DNA repair protein RecR
MKEEMERCPHCNTLAHGRFSAICHGCGKDKTLKGYVVPERKPFKNFLKNMWVQK